MSTKQGGMVIIRQENYTIQCWTSVNLVSDNLPFGSLSLALHNSSACASYDDPTFRLVTVLGKTFTVLINMLVQ